MVPGALSTVTPNSSGEAGARPQLRLVARAAARSECPVGHEFARAGLEHQLAARRQRRIEIEAGGAVAAVGGQRQAFAMRQAADGDLHSAASPSCQRLRQDARRAAPPPPPCPCAASFRRPRARPDGLRCCPRRTRRRPRRHVIGDDEIAAFARRASPGMGDTSRVSAAKPTTSRGRPAPRWRSWRECPDSRRARASAAPRRSFLILSPPASTRQSATAAAAMKISAGSAPPPPRTFRAPFRHGRVAALRIGDRHRAADQSHSRAGGAPPPPRWRGPACRRSGWRYSAPDRSAHASAPR